MSTIRFIAPPAPPEDFIFSEAVLWAGDVVVGKKPIRMSTVLGSCVAVCIYDPVNQFGGMNHYLVPRGGSAPIHGDWANVSLVQRMLKLGSKVENLQGKIFGGGCHLKLANESFAVGQDNITVAREVMAEFGIPIVSERVGHGPGLRLFYENWSGVVWVRPHSEKGDK